MRLLICVDDTDDLTKSTSTGKIADLILQEAVALGGVPELGITRHQLLIHDDIAYTSHNSSMCMVLEISPDAELLSKLKSAAETVLCANMAESSDPGLCFCRMDELKEPDRLIAFGRRAQLEVLKKEDAYGLAAELGGVMLCEYGGDGIGVIGALAGVGLRLSGCDGVFRGSKFDGYETEIFTGGRLKELLSVEQIIDFDGNPVDDSEEIYIGEKVKLSLLDGLATLIVRRNRGMWIACKKKDLYEGAKRLNTWNKSCSEFEFDNDIEEYFEEMGKVCCNCLYRRWTESGLLCMKKDFVNA